jgi:hypothetical protein
MDAKITGLGEGAKEIENNVKCDCGGYENGEYPCSACVKDKNFEHNVMRGRLK